MHITHVHPSNNPTSPERTTWSTGFTMAEIDAIIARSHAEGTYAPSRWEERFDMTHIHTMLHLLHTLGDGLPAFAQRWLQRRAARLPGLHGHFATQNGEPVFHSIEGEVIYKGETWVIHENGEWEKLW